MGKLGTGIKISTKILGKVTEVTANGAGKVISSVAERKGRDDIAKKAFDISATISDGAQKYSDKIGDKLGKVAEYAYEKGKDKAVDTSYIIKDKVNKKADKKDKFITVDKYEID